MWPFCRRPLSVNGSGLPAMRCNEDVHAFLQPWALPHSVGNDWCHPSSVKASLSKVTGLPNQWVTCICSESSAVTGKQLTAEHKLEQIKKDLEQRGLWVGFMSREDLLGLILNRIELHSQGEYYVSDLPLNDRVLPRKVAEELAQLQIFSSYCGKRSGWSRIFFPPLHFVSSK